MSLAHREKLLFSGKRIYFSGSCDRIHCCGFCSVALTTKSNQVMGEMSILAYIFRPQSTAVYRLSSRLDWKAGPLASPNSILWLRNSLHSQMKNSAC